MTATQITIWASNQTFTTVLSWQPWETPETAIKGFETQTGIKVLHWAFEQD